ncbi:hypothetical protein [Nitratireductor thuwali]|uniref:Uncharacterized protein n=1 Tax=Nitratireductor thuwali TaxID=2267699 RepID=A0ABY5MFI6_9HYPH|nr:hypothetical protein NTH_00999 [Nitratireductor thuwali]
MKTPYGIAGFDSSAALLQATACAIRGQGFPALGHSRLLEAPVRLSDMLPVPLRRQIYAAATGMEAVPRRSIGDIGLDEIADWAAGLYPQRRYPAVFIGSSNGALAHLATALGVPWLPQTFLVALRRKGRGVDDPRGDLQQARQAGDALLGSNPNIQLHQMHDPSQDRLSLQYITYFRTKFRHLPGAYRRFLRDRLQPGGTIILSDCTKRWPVTRVDGRYVFQFGAVGGMEPDEYLRGSRRVAEYLKRYGVDLEKWDPPEPDGESPEAEWGFEPDLGREIEGLAKELGLRVLRLAYEQPDDLSAPVADLHRQWHRERGLASDRLLVSSFALVEPHWALRTGSTPYWATFNAASSFAALHAYLERSEPFGEIGLMIFPHGTESVGLPSLDDWRGLLRRARGHGAFVGVNERAYPHHFSALARYHTDIVRIRDRYPLPPPLPLRRFEDFFAESGTRYPVRLVSA